MSEQTNRLVSGPILTSGFMTVLDHGAEGVAKRCLLNANKMAPKTGNYLGPIGADGAAETTSAGK